MSRIVRTIRGGFALPRRAQYIRGGTTLVNIDQSDVQAMSEYLGGIDAEGEYAKAPLRKVPVQSFALDTYPVTRRQFLDFVDGLTSISSSDTRKVDFDYWNRFGSECVYDDSAPIVSVTFMEAMIYAWFQGGRLPTEEEWELATRGHNQSHIPQASIVDAIRLKPIEREANYGRALYKHLLPVDVADAWHSPFGIQSLIGNADEWVDSPFDIRSTQVTDRQRFPDEHWGALLSFERIQKPVGLASAYPHPGRRSVFRRERGFEKGYCGGGVARSALTGFRCAYDL